MIHWLVTMMMINLHVPALWSMLMFCLLLHFFLKIDDKKLAKLHEKNKQQHSAVP